jgi:hypothetical protein
MVVLKMLCLTSLFKSVTEITGFRSVLTLSALEQAGIIACQITLVSPGNIYEYRTIVKSFFRKHVLEG